MSPLLVYTIMPSQFPITIVMHLTRDMSVSKVVDNPDDLPRLRLPLKPLRLQINGIRITSL